MTNEQRMLELAARCEAATGLDRELDAAIARAFGHPPIGLTEVTFPRDPSTERFKRYTSSLDAAMTLVPEGWTDVRVHWHRMTDGSTRCFAEVEHDVIDMSLSGEGYRCVTPALALCAAALRARASLKAQSTDTSETVMSDLCPFCGWKINPPPIILDGAVECPNCFARGPLEETDEAAIDAWKVRAPCKSRPASTSERT